MNTIKELRAKIKPLIDSWLSVDVNYNKWDTYKYEVVWSIITLTLKSEDEKWKISDDMLWKRFNNILKLVWAEVADIPYNSEIWYDDWLQWLYKHYPYWDWNFTNCCLIDSQSYILAVQYNWCKYTRCIKIDSGLDKRYIVLNNKKKIEGRLKYKDFEKLMPILKLI